MGKKVNRKGHRTSLDIMADILKASREDVKKTQLMYHCNLSFRQLEHYLALLIQGNLLKKKNTKGSKPLVFFEITEKGRKFLKNYKSLKTFIST